MRFGLSYLVGFVVFALLLIAADPTLAVAGGGPENLLLVVNRDDASSMLIANHYIRLRNIPAGNVVYLTDIPRQSLIEMTQFKSLILEPVRTAIQTRKLENQIDYVVYSAGFPTAVSNHSHRQIFFAEAEKQGEQLNEQIKNIFHPQASLTSLTYFAKPVLADAPVYMSMSANNYYRRPTEGLLAIPFVGAPQTEYENAIAAIASNDATGAIKLLRGLADANPGQLAVLYQLARAHGINGDAKEATEALIHAIRAGWCYRDHTQDDQAFAKIADDPLFSGIVMRIADERFDVLPTQGFSSRYSWGRNGSINSQPEQGMQYLLSTMLAMTWDSGNSEREALAQIERSVAADGTRPKGTFYFCDTADVRAATRKPNFHAAIAKLKRLGLDAEIVGTNLPERKRDINGAMIGKNVFKWSDSGSEILPGAICENLTSVGAVFGKEPGQTQLTEFFKYGAAGSCGTVIEPFALQAKFPHPLIHVHYARGCTLAEAFYQSVHGPFQLLIMGDALCRPWADVPKVSIVSTPDDKPVQGTINLEMNAVAGSPRIGAVEIYLNGKLAARRPGLSDVPFETNKVADGFHELRIVPISDDAIQTRGQTIIPLTVRNHGHEVKLTCDKQSFDVDGNVTVKVESNYGDRVAVIRGFELLGEKTGLIATFQIPAKSLGRGPVTIQAVGRDGSDGEVRSTPLQIMIDGQIESVPTPLSPSK